MRVQVKTITGVSCSIENVESVDQIKSEINNKLGISPIEQTLLFKGAKLEDVSLLEENSELHLIVDLEGGAKGKKKKKEQKKKKVHHRKKKVPLAILSYYKVDGDKVAKLKQMCKNCPPGTFLADHDDRLYCGRCRLAFNKAAKDMKKGGKTKAAPKKAPAKEEKPAAADKKGKKKK